MSAITWHELITTDVEGATRFYTDLLGLELETADMGDFQYQMLRKDGRTHAGFVAQQMEGATGKLGTDPQRLQCGYECVAPEERHEPGQAGGREDVRFALELACDP